MVFNIMLYRGSHHLHLYKFISLRVIMRCNKVYLSYQLPNASTIKMPIFNKDNLEGGTSNIKKSIRLTIPNLLIIPFTFLIPLMIHSLIVRLTTIHLNIVQGNEGEIICELIIMFHPMLRHVIWHSTFWFLNRSNTPFIWVWLLISMHSLFYVFEGYNIVC